MQSYRQSRGTLFLPKDKLEEAFSRLMGLKNNPEFQPIFPENYFRHCQDASDFLEQLNFSTCENSDGLEIGWFDSYGGDEEKFLSAIADLFPDGSQIDWRDDFGEEWHWTIAGGKLLVESCKWVPVLDASTKPGELGRIVYHCITC